MHISIVHADGVERLFDRCVRFDGSRVRLGDGRFFLLVARSQTSAGSRAVLLTSRQSIE